MKLALTLEYLSSLLEPGERVVISPTGIDTELHDQDEPAECLLNAHEYVMGLIRLVEEKKQQEKQFRQRLKQGWEQEKVKLRKAGM